MTELTLVPAENAGGSCACCAAPTDDATASKETPVTSSTTDNTVAVYTVSGMTCGHCVKSVTEEVSAIAGVSAVEVELATGQVTVTSAAPLSETDVKAAVDEAGYQLVA
jgi:copper ion binding protein